MFPLLIGLAAIGIGALVSRYSGDDGKEPDSIPPLDPPEDECSGGPSVKGNSVRDWLYAPDETLVVRIHPAETSSYSFIEIDPSDICFEGEACYRGQPSPGEKSGFTARGQLIATALFSSPDHLTPNSQTENRPSRFLSGSFDMRQNKICFTSQSPVPTDHGSEVCFSEFGSPRPTAGGEMTLFTASMLFP